MGEAIERFEAEVEAKAEQILGRSASALLGEPLIKNVPCIKAEGLFHDAVSVVDRRLREGPPTVAGIQGLD